MAYYAAVSKSRPNSSRQSCAEILVGNQCPPFRFGPDITRRVRSVDTFALSYMACCQLTLGPRLRAPRGPTLHNRATATGLSRSLRQPADFSFHLPAPGGRIPSRGMACIPMFYWLADQSPAILAVDAEGFDCHPNLPHPLRILHKTTGLA